MRVLLVEGRSRQHSLGIDAALTAQGIKAESAESSDDAIHLLRHFEFDLVLIDLKLADMDGTMLIRRIRLAKHETPIIALAAASQLRLKALTAGADDAVEHDINRAELIARMRAIIRRSRGFSHSLLQIGGLTLDVDQQDVLANGMRVELTGKEFAILELLVLRRNMIMTKEAILTQLYGGMDEPSVKIIDVFICKIRSKLAKAGMPNVISTVWGRGYSVRDNGADTMPTTGRPQPVQHEPVVA